MRLYSVFIITALLMSKIAMCQQPEIFGAGVISTGNYETHPAFSPSGDTIYFLKCTVDLGVCAICASYKKNNNWSQPEIVPFSGQYQDVDPFVTKDGNTFYFASNRPLKKNDPVKDDWDVWKVNKVNGQWSAPIHLDSPVNSTAGEYFPTIADNGNLYFGSARTGGKGGADIYVSKPVNGKYETIENAGDSINTTGNEYEPYISPDENYMIFMATPDRVSNADFYVSYHKNGQWTKAVKLDVINSSTTDWGGKMSRDGKYFYFGSTRSNVGVSLPQKENINQYNKLLNNPGNGLGDIYVIEASALHLQIK